MRPVTPAGRAYLEALAEAGGRLESGGPPARLPAYRLLIERGLVEVEPDGLTARLTAAGWRALGRRAPRKGGRPTYTPETAQKRRSGAISIKIDPDLAARLRSLADGYPGGISGWVADRVREAKDKAPG